MPSDGGHAAWARRWFAVACAVALVACLPAGEAPVGRHLIHDRSLTGVFFSPSERPGVPSHVLVVGPLTPFDYPDSYSTQAVADLYEADQGAAPPIEGLAVQAPVVRAVAIPGAEAVRYVAASDSLGRLLVMRSPADPAPSSPGFELARHDLVGGADEALAVLDLGQTFTSGQPPFLVSPTRSQLFAARSGVGWLFGPSSRQTVWRVGGAAFIDEDFYVSGVASAEEAQAGFGTNVLRLRPGLPPESLLTSSGQLGIHAIVGDFPAQLLLSLTTEQGARPFAVLDTERRASTSLPAEKGPAGFVSASPDGRLLLFATAVDSPDASQPRQYRLFVYEWMSGGFFNLDAGVVGAPLQGATEWRPGTSELWMRTLPDGFARWSPGRDIERFAGTPSAFRIGTGGSSWFLPDGGAWLTRSTTDGDDVRLTAWLVSADDPSAAPLRLNPRGTDVARLWPTEAGLLVEAWATDPRRSDLYLVDPATRTTAVLGGAGHLVTVGRGRALALLDWQLARASGRLVLIDLPGGAHTRLAEDVYAVNLERAATTAAGRAADPLAQGTRIAFLSRNRLESRDDGLWLAELP